MSRVSVLVLAVVAACSATPPGSLVAPPLDGAVQVPDDAGVDGPPTDSRLPGIDGGGVEPTDLAVICGGKEPVTLDEWEDCYQRRKCEWQVGCVSLTAFRDVADCMASGDGVSGGRQAAERRERERAVEQGRAQVNVTAFTQCLIRTSATRCNTALYDPACLTRFTGTIPDGGRCYTEIDCASPDALCTQTCTDACCLGTCQPKRKVGQTCTTFRSCEPGLQCNGICIAGDIGTPCRDVADCDPEAWCDLRAQRCRPTLAVGAECTDILQCGGDTSCIGTSVSAPGPGHCLRNSEPGDPCDGLCHGNLYCDATNKCRDLPKLNESCSALLPCAGANTFCKDGVCTLRSDIGVSCTNQTCLPGLFCALDVAQPACAARRAAGMPCSDPSHCESYLCSGNRTQPGVCQPWSDTCP